MKPADGGVPPGLVLEVFARDEGCLAPRLGGSYMDCWGRNTIAHVKAEPRAAKRAEPVPERLATICQGHMEDGVRAGYVWVTAKDNIARLREHLRSLYPDTYDDPPKWRPSVAA